MKYVENLKKLSAKDVFAAGGKGASLGEMIQVGIPVPDGFVVLSSAFTHFLESNQIDSDIEKVFKNSEVDDPALIEKTSEKIQSLILSAQVPPAITEQILEYYRELNSKFVAVRSSATSEDSVSAAWAGQLESYLNIKEADLITSIKKCWASLYSPRAIIYSIEKQLEGSKNSVAVVVQKMISSEKAGVAFTINPVTEKEEIVIEGALGLGEAVVSGAITPDNYAVEKESLKITESTVNPQNKALYNKKQGGNEWVELKKTRTSPLLSESEIGELSKILLNVEKHYGQPSDIEWAKEEGRFLILQSRPITTLSGVLKKKEEDEHVLLWSEKVSAPIIEFSSKTFISHSCFPWNDVKESIIFTQGENILEAYGLKSDLQRISQNHSEYFLDKTNVKNVLKKYKEIQDNFFNLSGEIGLKDFDCITDSDILNLLKKYISILTEAIAYFRATRPEAELKIAEELRKAIHLMEKNSKKEDAIFQLLTQPVVQDILFKEKKSIINLAEREAVDDKLLLSHALKYPTFYINTYNSEDVIETLKERVDEARKNLKSEKISLEESAERRINNKLKQDQIFSQSKTSELEYCARILQDFAIARLNLKSVWTGAEFVFLPLFEKISEKIGIDVETLFRTYTTEEMTKFLERGSKISYKEINDRKRCFLYLIKDGKEQILSGDRALKFIRETIESKADNSHQIKGAVANIGKHRGTAYILPSTNIKQLTAHIKNFKEGQVLVTDMTQPNMVLVMKKAGAIVTNQGGMTSHAAIISREFDIPCIIGTKNATKKIRSGDLIEVDANKGWVKIIKKA